MLGEMDLKADRSSEQLRSREEGRYSTRLKGDTELNPQYFKHRFLLTRARGENDEIHI